MRIFSRHDEQTADALNWRGKFGSVFKRRASPLTIKIVAFNLLALSLLIVGILFLNQSRDGLINLRIKTLAADAHLLANAISVQMDAREMDALNLSLAKILVDLSAPIDSDAHLFSADGASLSKIADTNENLKNEQAGANARTNQLGDILSDAWKRLASVFSDTNAPHDNAYMDAFRASVAQKALHTGNYFVSNSLDDLQRQIITIGVPIKSNGNIVGAVVVSTPSGEIDTYIREERQQILEVFLLAMLTSTFLSIVLANRIARPLRLLTEAAQKGSIQNANGVSLGRISIPDLTARPDEIGDLSRQMGNMTTALYDRIDANADFAADVAHEIKNPLTSLSSAVETMRYAKDDAARGKLLDVISDDVRRMDRLVTDISNASRLDAELANDDVAAVDLTELLSNLVSYQKDLAKDQGVALVTDFPDTPTIVPGLESRLAQVFVNLITNAVSFVPEGGQVKVLIAPRDEDCIIISVEDTGCGIPEENLKDVFKRFYSNRPQQQFGNNSGLGLAISKQIIDAHGGKIWAENIYTGDDTTHPDGARFNVVLPL